MEDKAEKLKTTEKIEKPSVNIQKSDLLFGSYVLLAFIFTGAVHYFNAKQNKTDQCIKADRNLTEILDRAVRGKDTTLIKGVLETVISYENGQETGKMCKLPQTRKAMKEYKLK